MLSFDWSLTSNRVKSRNNVLLLEFQITWHRNAEQIHAGTRFSFVHEGNFYCVDVAPVTVEDEGHWTCMAENRGGRSSCTSRLTVIGKDKACQIRRDVITKHFQKLGSVAKRIPLLPKIEIEPNGGQRFGIRR